MKDIKSPNISAVLLNWRRSDELGTIINKLKEHRNISEIIIWNNNTEYNFIPNLDTSSCNIKVINSKSNHIAYGRYEAADIASNDLIYTQDDDWFPGNIDYLLEKHKKNEITAFAPSTHIGNNPISKFVGWGAIYNKSCLSVFSKYFKKFQEDHTFYREADLFFTNMNNYTSYLCTPVSLCKEDERSLYLQPNHVNYHNQMLKRIKLINE